MFSSPDLAERTRIRSLLAEVLNSERFPEILLRKRRSWVAVPMESSSHFDQETITILADAIRREGSEIFYAVALEKLEDFPEVIVFPAVQQGVDLFNSLCSHFNFAIFSASLNWVYVCTTDGYYIVVGEVGFIQSAYNQEIYKLLEDFERYIDRSGSRTSTLLEYVFNKCKTIYRDSEFGDWISI
jgi:hypothetical protein